MDKLSIEAIQERFMEAALHTAIHGDDLARPFRSDVGYLLGQIAALQRENGQLHHALSMLAKDSLSPKQRRRIIEESQHRHGLEAAPSAYRGRILLDDAGEVAGIAAVGMV